MPAILGKHLVPSSIERIRISDYAINIFPQIQSRKALKKALKKKVVLVNNEVAFSGIFLKGGEIITLHENPNSSNSFVFEKKIEVLFEDDQMAAVLKPAGLSTSGQSRFNLENTLPFNLIKSAQSDVLSRPLVIHRLDYATSGIVLIGKTTSATINLNKQFSDKVIKKTYYAVTLGLMQNNYNIETPIDSKPSQTKIKVISFLNSEKYTRINLVQARPITGRTHQIRKHLASIGHPICGDNLYNKSGLDINGNGLYLHAQGILFLHPKTTEPITIETHLHKKFKRLFNDIL